MSLYMRGKNAGIARIAYQYRLERQASEVVGATKLSLPRKGAN